MLQAVQRNGTLVQFPIGILDAISKRVWRKKKINWLANAVGLNSAEIVKRDLAVKEGLKRGQSQ
jgi:hypothetical protein